MANSVLETTKNPRDDLPNTYTDVTARMIALSLTFTDNMNGIREMMKVVKPIKKQAGSQLVSYNADVQIISGIAPGCVIPYSKRTVTAVKHDNIDLEKCLTGVTIEEALDYGADVAVELADKALIDELTYKIFSSYCTTLQTGTLGREEAVSGTWQKMLAMAKGLVVDKFNKLHKTPSDIIGYANVLDFYDYLGGADITTQTQFGLQYIKDFMGYSTLFLLSEPDIPRGTVIATPSQNIVMYYIDPSDADIAKLGFNFVSAGEGSMLAVSTNGNTSTAVGELLVVYGVKFWAQYQDGIAVLHNNSITPAAETKSATKK